MVATLIDEQHFRLDMATDSVRERERDREREREERHTQREGKREGQATQSQLWQLRLSPTHRHTQR